MGHLCMYLKLFIASPKKPGRFSIMREVMIYLRVNDLLLSRITSTITPIPLWKAIDHNPQSKSLSLIKSLPPFEMNILPSLSTSLHYSIQKNGKLSKVTYQSSKGSEEDESHIE